MMTVRKKKMVKIKIQILYLRFKQISDSIKTVQKYLIYFLSTKVA